MGRHHLPEEFVLEGIAARKNEEEQHRKKANIRPAHNLVAGGAEQGAKSKGRGGGTAKIPQDSRKGKHPSFQAA